LLNGLILDFSCLGLHLGWLLLRRLQIFISAIGLVLGLFPFSVLGIALLLLQKVVFLLVLEKGLLLLEVLLQIHDILPQNLLVVGVLLQLLGLVGVVWRALENLEHIVSFL
jgi:hypothetical protein